MLVEIGWIALMLAFFLASYATIASLWGGRKASSAAVFSARNATILVFPLLTISVLILVYSLLRLDFSLAYVADVSSQAMSPFLRATALWGGQQGSMLFWAWIMSGFLAALMLRNWDDDREQMPYVIGVAMLTAGFFIGLVLFISNPFARTWVVSGVDQVVRSVFAPANSQPYFPQDGGGLNPLLRHFGMIGHPPTTYLGFTGFIVPYAFAMAALITGRGGDDRWIRTTRRWALVAWAFLSIGLILGGRWAYDVLGWGGFWGWDPVENAMLLPWLTGTAFLHSVMIQERRGMLKVWNMILIILTYSLSIFGTFITRTGVIGSVHAFAKSALGPAFFLFIGLTFLGSMSLLFRRLPTLKSEHALESFVSREAAFLLQNVLFLGITFAVFWGTIFPLLSELVTGTKITVGPPYFQKVTGPLFAGLVLLAGLAPLLAWRRQGWRSFAKTVVGLVAFSLAIAAAWGYAHRQHPSSWLSLWLVTFVVLAIVYEFWKGMRARIQSRGENPFLALGRLVGRNPSRYGGYLVHVAVMMIALAFVGDSYFKQETQGTLSRGERLTIGEYNLRFDDLRAYPGSDGREIVEAVTSLYRGDQYLGELKPRRDFFVIQQQPVTVPAVYSIPDEDVYVLLVGWEEVGLQATTFKIYLNPLINWAWLGGVFLVLGVGVAVWPWGEGRRAASYRPRPAELGVSPAGGD
ncbi:MAG TPA: heme lyase CcmF/NrfE family subunit [Anaerolineales bacterium]|nr:heme lyase CcmF/NrfE family subunit [Anaerolineales bacterium]